MAISYSDVVDVARVSKIIGTKYLNKSTLMNSGLVQLDTKPILSGSLVSWIRQTLFQNNPNGQFFGIDDSISFRNKTQTKYQIPVVNAGDGAYLDDIAEEISEENRPDVEKEMIVNLSDAITEQLSSILDYMLISTMDGAGEYVATEGTNYLDTAAAQLTAADIIEARDKRGDGWSDREKIMVCRAKVLNKLVALGATTESNNTLSVDLKNSIMRTGNLVTLEGFRIVTSDKKENAADGDYFIELVEANSLLLRGAGTPHIDPLQRDKESFQSFIKYYIRVAVGFEGLSFSGSASDKYVDTDLNTGTNWGLAVNNIKHLPLVRVRIPAPTF